MKKTLIGLSLSLGVLGLAGTAWADSWDVTQEVTIGTGTNTVEQSEANTAAAQGLNVIHKVDTLEKGSQEVKTGSNALTLTQKGTTGTSVQAGNLIKDAGDIGKTSQFEQKLTDATATITLEQQATGATNTQAVNYADAGTGDIIDLEQTVTTDGADIVLEQKTASSSQQIQAGNYAEAATIETLTQQLTAGKDLKLEQSGANDQNTQAGNYAKATTDIGTGKTLAQTAAADEIILTQTASGANGANLQAVNAVDTAAAAGTITQAVITGDAGKKITMGQTSQKDSDQFANYLHATGTVASVTQTYSNSNDQAELTQTDVDSSNQALNAIEMTGGSDALTAATQTVSVDTLKMEQKSSASTTDKAFQAGNLLLSATTAETATQTVTAILDLTQEKATASVQAGNLADVAAVTTKITQTVTGSATEDKLTQGADGATTSTQAANYLIGSGTIAAVEQTYGASTSATLTQGKIESGVQGLNVIDATTASSELTAGEQTVTVPTLTMTQGTDTANANTKSVQAANAVITASGATGGKVTQTVTAGTSLAMVQKNVSNSIQADNFAGAMPN